MNDFTTNIINLPVEEHNNLFNHVIYKKVFSPDECRAIINFEGKLVTAPFYGAEEKQKGTTGPKIHSICKGLNYNQKNVWMFQRLIKIGLEANKAHYNFIINNLQGTRVNEYRENEFIDWHVDIGGNETSTRKLSIIIFLSDEKDYDGGQVRWNPAPAPFPQEQGTVVVFPSYIIHTVEPITRGKRFSLVSWFHGPAFR
jgi:PKHD-type hydroxylase